MLHQQTQVLNLASYFLSKTDIFGFVFLFHFINVVIFEFIASWCLSVSMLCLCGFPPTCLRTCNFDKLSLRSNVFLAVIQQPLQGVRSEVQ